MNFTNTEFESRVYFENVMKHAAFYDCEFKDILRPYGKSTLTNCVFKTLDLSNLEVGESVVLTDCTYNGVSGINATLEATENGIEVECASGLITVADGLVVLAS